MKQLQSERMAPYAALGFLLLGEGLVWGTYARYMSPQFQQGVYVFHIAASFYHYFRSYGYARYRLQRKGVIKLLPFFMKIIIVNATIAGLGCIVLRLDALRPLRYIFDIQFFTFWVALHLVASDVFNLMRRPGAAALHPVPASQSSF